MESCGDILLVDQDHQVQDLIGQFSAQYGYEMDTADTGEMAVELISQKKFEVVIADSGESEIDGLCIVNMIKVVNPETRVLLMGDDNLVKGCLSHLRAGWDDFIRKPLHPEELKFRAVHCIEGLNSKDKEASIYMQSISRLQSTLEATLKTLAEIVETRDPFMAGHQQGVSDLAESIALGLNLSESEVEMIRIAGAIHDIGKISIPIEILNKPGNLNDYEFGLVKNHPKVGYDITKGISFPWPLAKILHQHHERWDGSGYPDGLSGEDIHIGARILSVADVLEAMSARRSFRSAKEIDDGLTEILTYQDIFYDPEIVNVCLKLFE